MEKTINHKTILEAVKKIPTQAIKENWVFTLDRDEGALFYSLKNIPRGAELFQVTDEAAIYLDRYLNPKGVMLEYYGQNFIKHHPEFARLSERIFGKDKQDIKIVNPKKTKKEDISVFRALLERTIISEAFKTTTHGSLK